MSRFDRLEALAQRLVEGPFNRIFNAGRSPTPADAPNTAPPETKEVLRLYAGLEQARRWALQLDGRRVTLGEPVLAVGRALDNDVVLNDSAASRYHARLRWRDGRYLLYPPDASLRQSSAGAPHTLLNGHPAGSEPAPLSSGDTLTLGNTEILVVVDEF
ncbi:MAG: FHA domain-containing protein [Chloroflexi bacterium]|nr:MAG: FHA domain-containing protein [Chloroflexota bacterium]